MPQRRKISLCGHAAFAPAETPRGGTAWKTKTPARQQLDSCAQSLACAPPGLKTHLGAASPYSEVLRDEGEMSIVLVEQYFDFAVRLADQFVVLNRGAVSHTSTRATLNREALLSAVSI